MKLSRYLASLGYGTRRDVERLCAEGRVTHRAGRRLAAADQATHADILVDGEPLDVPPGTVIMLHKPAGFVCSTSEATRLVYELLPERFLRRTPVVAVAGRLDRDTSGLLLLTDDGPLNHRLTSPRTHLPKIYDARLAADLRGDEGATFASGAMRLEGEAGPLCPATLDVLGPRHARLTLTEGRYHQVRRMFAAVGNHVTALHRSALGPLSLGQLRSGEWRVLGDHELQALRDAFASAGRPPISVPRSTP